MKDKKKRGARIWRWIVGQGNELPEEFERFGREVFDPFDYSFLLPWWRRPRIWAIAAGVVLVVVGVTIIVLVLRG